MRRVDWFLGTRDSANQRTRPLLCFYWPQLTPAALLGKAKLIVNKDSVECP